MTHEVIHYNPHLPSPTDNTLEDTQKSLSALLTDFTYESSCGCGTMSLMPHHVKEITETLMPFLAMFEVLAMKAAIDLKDKEFYEAVKPLILKMETSLKLTAERVDRLESTT